MKKLIITGAAGFIGSALCRFLHQQKQVRIIGVDKMSYASSLGAVAELANDADFELVQADITDSAAMLELFNSTQPDGVIHLAAETHVDRSIDRPGDFIYSNIVGTYALLETTRYYLAKCNKDQRKNFRFLHVSTDEVYGSLGNSRKFTETTAYAPNSPYAASKAGSDHLVMAWYKTYNLPIIISNCSNNYGPFQFPEKLIPLCLSKALRGENLPIYGKGENVRDWLYVEDHAAALHTIFTKGQIGEKYHVGGGAEWRNLDLVELLCNILDETLPNASNKPHRQLIKFVADRPGHDERYAMDYSKLKNMLGWQPSTTLPDGLRKTVNWYLANQEWLQEISAEKYGGERLGTAGIAGNR